MSSIKAGLLAGLAIVLAGCAGSFMQLRECRFSDCYTIRKGVTPQEFFGNRVKVLPAPDLKYQLDSDVWDVWVFDVGTVEPAVIPVAGDATSGGAVSQFHSEYVAFRNGRLDDWGWGKFPRVLRKDRQRLVRLKG